MQAMQTMHLCKKKCLKGDLSGPRVVPNGPRVVSNGPKVVVPNGPRVVSNGSKVPKFKLGLPRVTMGLNEFLNRSPRGGLER